MFVLFLGCLAPLTASATAEPPPPNATPPVQTVLDSVASMLGRGKASEALSEADSALGLARAAGDLVGEATAQSKRALALEALRRPAEASAGWRQSASSWARLGALPEQIEALCGQAVLAEDSDSVAAGELLQRAIALASSEHDRPLAVSGILIAASIRAQGRSKPARAEALGREAMALTSVFAPDSLAHARSLHNLGVLALRRGDLDAARTWFERALTLRQRLAPGTMQVAATLNNLGIVALDRGDLDEAERNHLLAHAIIERLEPGSLDLAGSDLNLANIAIKRGKLDVAQDALGRVLAIQERLAPGSLEEARSLHNLGAVSYERGQLDVAQSYHARALEIREHLEPGSLEVAASLLNLGAIDSEHGDLDGAAKKFRQALTIRQQLAPGSLDVAASLSALAKVAWDHGELGEAQLDYEQALQIEQELAPGSLELASTLDAIGSLASDRGDLEAARESSERALAIDREKAPGSLAVASVLTTLGTIAWRHGDLAAARRAHEQALAIRMKLAPGSLDVSRTLVSLGIVAYSSHDLVAARHYHERALAIQDRLAPGSLDVAMSLSNLGGIDADQGRSAKAQDEFEQARRIREALDPASVGMAVLLGNLGKLAGERHHPAVAESAYARAWSIIGGERRFIVGDEATRAFGAAHADLAADFVLAQLDQRKRGEAFGTLEEGRARGLLELFSERGMEDAAVDSAVLAECAATERAFHRAEQALEAAGLGVARLDRPVSGSVERGRGPTHTKELAAARQSYAEALVEYTRARLSQDHALATLRSVVPGLAPRISNLESARRAIPPGSVYVSWMLGEKRSAVFVIPADSSQRVLAEVLTAGEREFAKHIAAFRDRITSVGATRGVGGLAEQPPRASRMENLVSASRQLYEKLLPAAGRAAVAAAHRIILSPDGPLWELPFAALVTNPNGPPQWLGLEKPLSLAPSLSVLGLPRERRVAAPSESALVVGDPTLGSMPAGAALAVAGESRSPWRGERILVAPQGAPPPLPASRREAQEIAALLGTTALTGEAATEAAVRRRISTARFVHLATHGYFNPTLPMSSGVLLASPPDSSAGATTDDDGVLQAWEFGRALPLAAELVVLSACDTGRGTIARGEGLVGMTRALQVAGARTVVATQWKVADQGTSDLMVRFYRGLEQGLPRDEALRGAMLTTASVPATRDPFYWSPFVLMGAPAESILLVGREPETDPRPAGATPSSPH